MPGITTAVVAGAGVVNAAYQGKKARDAASEATQAQVQASQQASDAAAQANAQFRQDLSPYRTAGEAALPVLQELALNPQKSVDMLQSNPLFQAALNSRQRSTLGAAANAGRIGTGGLSKQLSEDFLLSAMPLLAQQEQRLNNLVSLGQSSSAQVGGAGLQTAGAIGSNLMQGANAAGAGAVAQQQINAQRNSDILNAIPGLVGGIGGLIPRSGGQQVGVVLPEVMGVSNYA